jgi:hypothetical protein
MGIAKFVLLAAGGCYITTGALAAEQSCPLGPFETNLATIASALAATTVPPGSSSEASASPDDSENGRLTDGAEWISAGGFMSDRDARSWMSYDAKRYQSIVGWSVPGQATEVAQQFRFVRVVPGVVVRQVAATVTYVIVTARLTPEQARKAACLANQMFTPKEYPPKSPVAQPRHHGPAEVTVTASQSCGAHFGPDGYTKSFYLLTIAPDFLTAGRRCPTQDALERQLREVVLLPVNELLRQARGGLE